MIKHQICLKKFWAKLFIKIWKLCWYKNSQKFSPFFSILHWLRLLTKAKNDQHFTSPYLNTFSSLSTLNSLFMWLEKKIMSRRAYYLNTAKLLEVEMENTHGGRWCLSLYHYYYSLAECTTETKKSQAQKLRAETFD